MSDKCIDLMSITVEIDEGHHIKLKGSFQEEDTTIINI